MKLVFKILGVITVLILAGVISALLNNKDPKTEYYGEEYLLRSNHYTLMNSEAEHTTDGNYWDVRIGSFEGRKAIWPDNEIAPEDVDLKVTLSVAEGHCKLVYADPKTNTVQTIIECSGDTAPEGTATFHIDPGIDCSSLKLVGYDCRDIHMTLTLLWNNI